jgi:hypothetical protein
MNMSIFSHHKLEQKPYIRMPAFEWMEKRDLIGYRAQDRVKMHKREREDAKGGGKSYSLGKLQG